MSRRSNWKTKKRLLVATVASIVFIFIVYVVHGVVQHSVDWKGLLNSAARPICKNCNVILITLDTLGANHLPCYGYTRNTAPNLCAYAKSNILFTHAYANASWTLPSDVSLFTSWYPEFHGLTDSNTYNLQLPSAIPFLPEILQKNGYDTYFAVPPDDHAFPIHDAYAKGITRVIPIEGGQNENLDNALSEFLENVTRGNKTFLFLHSNAVHGPYITKNPHKMYTTDSFPNIPTSLPGEDVVFSQDFYLYLIDRLSQVVEKENSPIKLQLLAQLKSAPTLSQAKKLADEHVDMLESYYDEYDYFAKINLADPRQIEYVKALYDQKIFEIDTWIGNVLIPFLNNTKLKENTVVIITSEHGEEFMEHGYITHITLYDSNEKIPLIMHMPAVEQKMIEDPVQIVDITPTILDVLGISLKPFLFQGTSLFESILGNSIGDRLLIANRNKVKTVRNAQWKMFMLRDNKRFIPYELYDIEQDPTESVNVFASHVDVVKRLLSQSDLYDKKWQNLMAGR